MAELYTIASAGEPHRATLALQELAATIPAWMSEGVCARVDPEKWFPASGETAEPAKRVCADCTVRVPCLQYALDNNEHTGIWGGMTASERKRIAKEAS